MALAITANAQLNWGVKAGLNVSSFSGIETRNETDGNSSYSSEQGNKAGFHLGVNMQYMFTPQVGIESGLFYSTLGTKLTSSEKEERYTYKSEDKINTSYIQLPIAVLYKFNVGQDLYLYPSLGLYAGYGLNSKVKYEGKETYNGETEKWTEEYSLFKESDEWDEIPANRFDMGLAAGLTLQYSKFTIGLGYEQGLTTFDKKLDEDYSFSEKGLKNRNLKVSVGYFF